MRIVAGESKGAIIRTPKGYRMRPTSALVKKSLFSMLENLKETDSQFLDLYAGSGALGMEALSRGAKGVDFVEQNERASALIKKNLTNLGFSEKARVYRSPVKKAISFLDKKYDIVLLDPPYNSQELTLVMEALSQSNIADKGTILAIPHSSRTDIRNAYGLFHLLRQRRHGDTTISIYIKEEEKI